MKLPKLSRSRPSSANASPSSSPRLQDSWPPPPPSSTLPSPFPADLPHSPNLPSSKSFWPEKGKSLQLRLPSLSRSKSRSKHDFATASGEPSSPIGLPSPLGRSNSNQNLVDANKPPAVPNLQVICTERAGASNGSKGTVPIGSSNVNTSDPLVEEIKHVFKKFDTNGDGKISADELRCVLRSLGDNTTQEEAELMVAEVDTDRDGFIDLQEFIDLNMRAAAGGRGVNGEISTGSINVMDELAAAFNMFDLDKNGCITPDELHCVLRNLGNCTSTLEDCKRMICGVDRKGSGHVDFDDFKIMMTSNNTIMA